MSKIQDLRVVKHAGKVEWKYNGNNHYLALVKPDGTEIFLQGWLQNVADKQVAITIELLEEADK